MKKILLLICLIPFLGQAQKNSKTTKKSQVASNKEFVINGSAVGYPDGTVVDLINGNNRNPEGTTKLQKGKFVFIGKVQYPDFKLISFNKSSDLLCYL